MEKKYIKKVLILGSILLLGTTVYTSPIIIDEQGSFFVGGEISKVSGTFDSKNSDDNNPYKIYPEAGQTLHSDHAYVSYQKPINMKKYPLVFLHGGGQSGKSWETTPDGREGFNNIFLRKNYGVYIVDQPRRGRAGLSSTTVTIVPTHSEQYLYNFFRIGLYPDYFEGVQFAKDEETLNQYFRQVTPNTGNFDEKVVAGSMSNLFDKIGEGVLVAHSQGSGPAMESVLKNSKIKGLAIYEPGGCNIFFPEGEDIEISENELPDSLYIQKISKEEFKKFLEIPIVIYFGDNIPNKKSEYPILEEWRLRLKLVKKWAEIVNKNGGDVQVIHLPEIGIKGNTHFPFSDLNNMDIANLLEKWLEEKNLNN